MSTRRHPRRVRPPAYRKALLILAVLAGVLAMHGLAPGTAVPAHAGGHAHAGQTAHARPAAHVTGDACDHVDAGRDGAGHARHADSTCAAAGVSGAPAQPTLPAGTVPVAGGTTPHARPAGATAPGRAPPDLAQLQLLRI
ncbi:DUF6153 family protein [Streptomyces lavendofoliae]|uniref:DUF6153 family protein n=1 Tax=Streptomyces lavendofoliae TaxID=67314 RepID=UPI003D8E573B